MPRFSNRNTTQPPPSQRRLFCASNATLIWFHGGALKNGSKHIDDRLKRQGIAIVAANYRMYPKVGTPVPIEDAATAWVFEHIAEFGGDPEKIFISGHPDATLYEFDGYGHNMIEPAHPVALNFINRILEKKAK